VTITNVSYDPTRELYAAYNAAFSADYEAQTGQRVEIIQSHGGSGAQAKSVVDGANADVVTLALAHDITLVEKAGLIEPGWIEEFDRDSSPYTSTIVFLVRAGNEKNIRDWDDLTREGVGVITPDPKSSGAACWNFLAAWRYADQKLGGDEGQIGNHPRFAQRTFSVNIKNPMTVTTIAAWGFLRLVQDQEMRSSSGSASSSGGCRPSFCTFSAMAIKSDMTAH